MTPSSVLPALPVASSTPAVSATPAANPAVPAPDVAVEQGSQDFLLMLGQLLGTTAPTPSTTAQLAPVVAATDAEVETTEPLDGAALEAMLAFTPMTPWTAPPAVAPATSAAADALSSTALSALLPGSGSETKSVLEGLATLTETQPDGTDAAQFANLNASATTPKDVAQEVRAAASSDTSARGLHTPVGSSQWADELGTRMTWMAERGHQVASLRLSPEHLGPLEVRISIRDDQASVWFGAAHADTRAAIEQALPRLREMFDAQGLTLADTGVFQEAPRNQSQPQAIPGLHGDGVGEAEGSVISIAQRRLGLIDAYA